MTWAITARFINGVLVPDEVPPLAENDRVTMVLLKQADATAQQALLSQIEYRRNNRMKVDPALAKAIIEDHSFDLENWD